MDNDQLEIKLKAALGDSIADFNKLTQSAANFNKELSNLIIKADASGNALKAVGTIETMTGNMSNKIKVTMDGTGKVIGKTFSQIEKSSKKASKGISRMFDLNYLQFAWNVTKGIRDTLKSIVNSAVDYNETVNKFKVTMGTERDPAMRFVNDLAERYGIARTELMNYQSTYKSILSGLGDFTAQQSERISESLTKMALDYSSLFNVERGAAMNKFQAALTGSIRPIRSDSGYDVSEQTIGEKAKELGVERTVGQLTQMEKRILRIIVLMEQMKTTGAFDDLARTIEEPANQIKVLKDQIQELGVWIGNVFMGTIGAALPYINAFVMTIKELVKMFAIFVGFESNSTNLAEPFETAEDATQGISSGIGSANKKAKELKKTLMGFDVLNVITTPKDTAGSKGGGGGIDPKILKALDDYESKMKNVTMRATEIRDRIMEWLGFTKQVDATTGDISWKLKEGYTNIEKIRDVILLILSAGIAKKVLGVVKNISEIPKMFKGITKTIASLGFSGVLKSLITIATTAGGVAVTILGIFSVVKGIIDLIQGDRFSGVMNILIGIAATVAGIATLFAAWPVALGAAIVAAVGLIVKVIGENWEKISTFFGDIWTKFNEKVVSPIVEFVKGIADQVWTNAIEPIVSRMALILNKSVEIGAKVLEILGVLGKAAYDYMIKPLWDFIASFAQDFWNKGLKPTLEFFAKAWSWIKSHFINPLIDAFKGFGIIVSDFIGGAIKGVINGLLTLIENRINGFIRLLNNSINIINKIPNVNISKVEELSIPKMAGGGFPSVGEMFVAREAGPELVGKIGNSNAVVNNKQIVEAVSTGVANAVRGVLGNNQGGDIRLYLDGKELTTTIQRRQNRNANIFGTA